ncbi:hypothetical protein [Pedobacter sp. MC2016-24]|uniref:hypothetical protein n=1 Tax=Pedobacter sp. MC2016-24 TaxID=2780090 RepID=UPI0018827040|nr:hypothetical protein [Pedobacter sp. MC2016-24]MBE9602755.1 hypothetical protein [Pedobacter sp. MC2016-24]
MATFDGKFIRGIAGNVIFKQRGKKQVIQGKSKKKLIDMTRATFDAAFIFGRASTLSSYIRSNASQIIRFNDSGMISRFTGECNQVLQKAYPNKDHILDHSQDYFSRLNGFEFNQASPLKNYFFAQPMVTLSEQQVTIDLPELDIPRDLKPAMNANFCIMAFDVMLFDLENGKYKQQEIQSFEIPLKNLPLTIPAQQLVFEGSPAALCVIALGIYYFEKTFAGTAMMNHADLSPSALLKAAFCPGIAVVQDKWHDIDFKEKRKRKKLDKAKKTKPKTSRSDKNSSIEPTIS